ncbi:barstar family protein [Halobacteriovorax sp. HFRX-2_2]|uniref:barstar family protein n=1 Tax=unclassified Halobacteriovorax TaxID=2639665 RepID=UPI00371647D9
MRREIELNSNGLDTLDDYLVECGRLFDFPSFYTNNIDELYEFIQTYTDKNLSLYWTNTKDAQNKLGQDYYRLKEVFDLISSQYSEFQFHVNE